MTGTCCSAVIADRVTTRRDTGGMPTMTVVNLEAGMPTVMTAKSLLSQALRTAHANRTHLLKLIHGYGSSGKGGAIRSAVRRELVERKRAGQIVAFIPGEDFSPFNEDARMALSRYPELSKDRDYSRQNHGITIVVVI